MPEISRFLGISIRISRDDHPPPHFHAGYNEFAARVSIAGPAILEGRLPPANPGLCRRVGHRTRGGPISLLAGCPKRSPCWQDPAPRLISLALAHSGARVSDCPAVCPDPPVLDRQRKGLQEPLSSGILRI
ncbi:MAG: DUF4160 domain-containing protein [Limisphaerales bacterium]